MGEVSLRRIEQFLLGVALQLRPTLAKGDPAVLSIDCGHIPSVRLGSRRAAKERRWLLMAVAPGGHGDS
jgi:hypothetical protein